jgi:hypothetical protein
VRIQGAVKRLGQTLTATARLVGDAAMLAPLGEAGDGVAERADESRRRFEITRLVRRHKLGETAPKALDLGALGVGALEPEPVVVQERLTLEQNPRRE